MRIIARAATVLAGLALAIPAGCQEGTTSDDAFGVRLRFLTDEGLSSDIPSDLNNGLLRICFAPPDANCDDGDDPSVHATWTEIGNPEGAEGLYAPSADLDGDGRPERAVEGLPYDVTLKLVVTAHTSITGPAVYSSRADGIRLAKGSRRFVTVTLFPTSTFATVDPLVSQVPETFKGGIGASVTTLSDGRLLIAGGFDFSGPAMTPANCATAAPTAPAGSVCFQMLATPKAYIFEPGSARIWEVATPMTEATGRAFHTASALPDDRVVFAGGVDTAVMVFAPIADGSGFLPSFIPVATSGYKGFHTTFEIFDPNLGALTDDPNRDGNRERGGFVVGANLAVPRAFSVGALWPDADPAAAPRVIVFGGMDVATAASRPPTTWEIWNQGGSATFALGSGGLTRGRVGAGLGLMRYASPELWLVGGAPEATGDFDIISIWSATTGAVTAAIPSGATNAGKNFTMPAVTPLGNAEAPTALLVTGSMGPQCTFDGTTYTPVYNPYPADARPCPPATIPPYVVNKSTATLQLSTITGWVPATDSPHVLGASATLGDGSVILIAGASDLNFVATRASHRVIWTAGVATKDAALPATAYPVAAILPAAASTLGGDAVFVGGMTVTLTGTPAVTLLDDIVVYNYE
jgi:hypothetical protein